MADNKQQAKAKRTRAGLLDAASEVVRTEGVSGLTLERVAAVAGVSKGGLLYHFATKQDLVIGLLSNTLGQADSKLNELADTNHREAGSFAQAYLDYVRAGNHTEVDSGSSIFAAAALEDGDLAPAQELFKDWQDRLVSRDGIDPTVGLLARVVGDGLWLIDLFGLASPTAAQRSALFALVESLLDDAASGN